MPSGATPATPSQTQTASLPSSVQGSVNKTKTEKPEEKLNLSKYKNMVITEPLAINKRNSNTASVPKGVAKFIEKFQVPANEKLEKKDSQVSDKKDLFDKVLDRKEPQIVSDKKDRVGGVFKESKDGYPITQRAADIAIPLQPNTNPRVPLESPIAGLTGMTGFDMSKKLNELITAVQTIRGGESSNNSAASINSSTGGSSVTNVFNNGTERDIPYTERTKYRNQIMYSRALL